VAKRVILTNGQVVLPDRILAAGEVMVEDGVIQHTGQSSSSRALAGETVIDAEGGFILPGFIDMHCDAIEKEMEPRPGAFFDMDIALPELEKKLAGQGITSMYHSFSFAGAEYGIREDCTAANCVRHIIAMKRNGALIRNKIHLRFEITNYPAVELIRSLIADGVVDVLSFMDHTPGQGQYPTVNDYKNYLEKTYHMPFEKVQEILSIKEQGRMQAGRSVETLCRAALLAGVTMASHDDDDKNKVHEYAKMGVRIHEFPIRVDVAKAARAEGNSVCVGAPNIVRGKSTGKGMLAMDAITAGAADIICSDYHPSSVLHSIFKLSKEAMSLPEAVAMASLNPAQALALHDLGSLETGKKADILVVNIRGGSPVVTTTVVDGIPVYSIQYRRRDFEDASFQEKAG